MKTLRIAAIALLSALAAGCLSEVPVGPPGHDLVVIDDAVDTDAAVDGADDASDGRDDGDTREAGGDDVDDRDARPGDTGPTDSGADGGGDGDADGGESDAADAVDIDGSDSDGDTDDVAGDVAHDAGDADTDAPDECSDEVCNGVDDDCDGAIDEGFDTSSDPLHCGACDRPCALANAESVCFEGACRLGACSDGWADCNDDPEDGCEVDLSSPTACDECADGGSAVGERCGICGSGTWECVDGVELRCAGEDPGGQVCEPGATELQREGCGACSRGERTRVRVCAPDGCSWGPWSSWSSCVGAPCSPGTTRPGPCGSCSEQTCNDRCEWSGCALRAGAECDYDRGETMCCGLLQERSCTASCTWSACRGCLTCGC